ncbi:MAG: putative Ig domain-containing protein [Pseudomonadota bacterium]
MQGIKQAPGNLRSGLSISAAAVLLACAGCSGGGADTEQLEPTTGDDGAADNVAPSLAITSPDDDGNATVAINQVTVAGEASDNVGIQTMRWRSDRGGVGNIAVRENWETGPITLQNGMNVISVEAEDQAGNKSEARISIVQDPNGSPSEATAMISYSANLSNAMRLEDATVDGRLAYLFFEPSQRWEDQRVREIDFYCCKALSGQAQAHLPRFADTSAPFVYPIDLSQFSPGTRRELYVDVYFQNGPQTNQVVEFNLSGAAASGSNTPPTITGSPDTLVGADFNYGFTPMANDPDGDMLTFFARNLPSWLSFDVQTGELSGTPTVADAGTYSNIQVGVTDGSLTDELPPFAIDVTLAANASLTVDWIPPTENVDGTPVAGLAGYKIFFGQQPGNYGNSVEVNSGGLNSYTIDNVTPGTWYVAMTATDVNGLESGLSSETSKVAR